MAGRVALPTRLAPIHHLTPAVQAAARVHSRRDKVACQASRNRTNSAQDYQDDDDLGTDNYLRPKGARNSSRPDEEPSAQHYDIEEDWGSLDRMVSTTGLAKASSPQVGSGQQATKLMRPPSNPKIDRLRRDSYDPRERRLFRQDDSGITRDMAGAAPPDMRQRQDAAEASRRQLQALPDLQLGKAASPEPPAAARRLALGGQRDDSADKEEERFEQALRKGWQQSQQENAAVKLQLQRPERPGHPSAPGRGSSSPSQSTRDVTPSPSTRSFTAADMPSFGVVVSSGRPVVLPSAQSSNSSVLLTIASAMAEGRKEEARLDAIVDDIEALRQRALGAAQAQQNLGTLKPRPTSPARPGGSIAAGRHHLQPPPRPLPASQQQQDQIAEGKGRSSFQHALQSAVARVPPQAPRVQRQSAASQSASMTAKQKQAASEQEEEEADIDLEAFSKAIKLAMGNGTQAKQRLNRPGYRN